MIEICHAARLFTAGLRCLISVLCCYFTEEYSTALFPAFCRYGGNTAIYPSYLFWSLAWWWVFQSVLENSDPTELHLPKVEQVEISILFFIFVNLINVFIVDNWWINGLDWFVGSDNWSVSLKVSLLPMISRNFHPIILSSLVNIVGMEFLHVAV